MNPNHIGTNFDDFLKEEGIMTDNIQKLYETAGIKLSTIYFCPSCGALLYSLYAPDGISYRCEKEPHCDYELNSWDEEYEECINELNKINVIPPFTAEKQLELIKWLATKQTFDDDGGLMITIYKNMVDVKFCPWTRYYADNINFVSNIREKSFDQALAGLVIELYQDLTPDQKQEIKEILQ